MVSYADTNVSVCESICQHGKKLATFVSAYAPTMTNPDEVKDKFYEDLNALISNVPTSDKLTILGDFNARVGCDSDSWDGIIGKHGVGKCNSNGLLLLQTCAEHDLLITNTIFRLPTRKKTSWMHPAQNIGTSLTTSLSEEKTDRISVSQKLCVVRSAGQITVS